MKHDINGRLFVYHSSTITIFAGKSNRFKCQFLVLYLLVKGMYTKGSGKKKKIKNKGHRCTKGDRNGYCHLNGNQHVTQSRRCHDFPPSLPFPAAPGLPSSCQY